LLFWYVYVAEPSVDLFQRNSVFPGESDAPDVEAALRHISSRGVHHAKVTLVVAVGLLVAALAEPEDAFPPSRLGYDVATVCPGAVALEADLG
jgi:hypothetical protein